MKPDARVMGKLRIAMPRPRSFQASRLQQHEDGTELDRAECDRARAAGGERAYQAGRVCDFSAYIGHSPSEDVPVTDDTQDTAAWPQPKFFFSVDIGGVGTDLPFQEVSGLDMETQAIEYRAGKSPTFAPVNMPGIQKPGHVTLKRGVFVKDNTFFDWYRQVALNTIKRTTVTIKLLDESGAAAMTWTLKNAWPTKITGTDLKSDGNEVAVESLELAHEGLDITRG
jgi:phage tail-like protein